MLAPRHAEANRCGPGRACRLGASAGIGVATASALGLGNQAATDSGG